MLYTVLCEKHCEFLILFELEKKTTLTETDQDFQEGVSTPKIGTQTYYFWPMFLTNCMQMKNKWTEKGSESIAVTLRSANNLLAVLALIVVHSICTG